MPVNPGLPLILACAALALSALTAASVAVDRLARAVVIRDAGDVASPPAVAAPEHLAQIMYPIDGDDDGDHVNQMISLAHNWAWHDDTGWSRRDASRPSVALTVESWYRGLAELNFDMRPPRDHTPWPGGRPLGLFARHDGTYASLFVGGKPYSVGAAGIQLTGGFVGDPIISIAEPHGGDTPTLLRVERPDRDASVVLGGGAAPFLSMGLSGVPADQAGEGVFRVSGSPAGAPIIAATGVAEADTILAVRASADDAAPRLRLAGDGRIEWGGGAASPDAALSRTAPGRVRLEGELAASALRVGDGNGIRAVRLVSVEFAPAVIRGASVAEQMIAAPGLNNDGFIVVNGPAQPAGIGVVGARLAERGMVGVSFFNVRPEPARPTSGKYVLLVVEMDE